MKLVSPTPDAIGKITDKKLQNRNRIKFGIGSIMYQGEEAGLGPVHTAIIHTLEGNSVHLGWLGTAGSVSSLVQWLGALLLSRFQSSRKAMAAALAGGIAAGLILAFLLLLASAPSWRPWCLIGYVVFALVLAGASGIQINVETSWIGDLVPHDIMGWFTSMKWLIGALGALAFMMIFGWAAEWGAKHPHYELTVYAGLLATVGFSHLLALLLILTISDRTPQTTALFFAKKAQERLDYGAAPFWGYIAFFILWSGGRGAMNCFATAYMLSLSYSMTKIASLLALQYAVSMVMLMVLGRITDRFGARRPLIVVSAIIAGCMSCWILSAWFGMFPILCYMLINGAAGHAHSMLAINYGQEIFPSKGRAGYFGISRLIIGPSTMLCAVAAGYYMQAYSGVKLHLWGAELTAYHLLFAICTVISMSCVIPLLLLGNKTIQPAPHLTGPDES